MCRTWVEVQPRLSSVSSISISSSIVAISVASKSRPSQLPLLLCLRHLACGQPTPDSEPQQGTNRQSRCAAAGSNGVLRVVEVGQGREAQSRTQRRDGRVGSTRKMERSEALARDKPGMYQHQREVENSISITMQSYTHVG